MPQLSEGITHNTAILTRHQNPHTIRAAKRHANRQDRATARRAITDQL